MHGKLWSPLLKSTAPDALIDMFCCPCMNNGGCLNISSILPIKTMRLVYLYIDLLTSTMRLSVCVFIWSSIRKISGLPSFSVKSKEPLSVSLASGARGLASNFAFIINYKTQTVKNLIRQYPNISLYKFPSTKEKQCILFIILTLLLILQTIKKVD